MADPIDAWHMEQRYFRRLLALPHKQVDVFHKGEQPNYELMLDIVSPCMTLAPSAARQDCCLRSRSALTRR